MVLSFFGTSNGSTHKIISKYNANNKFGVCMNMYGKISKKCFEQMESLNLPVFLDNGSFERFISFIKKELSAEEYFDFNSCKSFFEEITTKYQAILGESKNPSNIILTIPEVIGSAELTQALQKEYIPIYEAMQKEYGFKIIISLQFNPHSEDWINEVLKASEFIRDNANKNWIVGIPFGNDFKLIQKKENYIVIEEAFATVLKGRKAHLFACGSVNKIKNFVIGKDFIYSIDASSIMNISKYSHYLSTETQKVLDIRALKGKSVKPETQQKKLDEMKRDSGMDLADWEKMKYSERFEVIFSNFQKIYENQLNL